MKWLQRILTTSVVQHLVFWMLSFYAIGSYFSVSNTLVGLDLYYSALFHIPLLYVVYVNTKYLIPRFMREGRYLIYGLLTVFTLGAGYFIHELTFEILLPILPTDYYMVSFTDREVIVGILVIYWALSTLLKLSKAWYRLQQLEKEKLSLELNSLKAQINPHFLFNTLNSMYSLAHKKSDNTTNVILQLSSLLRYMIYEVGEDKVPLADEIKAINHYLDLQKLRVEDTAEIIFRVEGKDEGIRIAPLLFFPLIENSFKHGLKGGVENAFLHIHLKAGMGQVQVVIRNSMGQVDEVEHGKYGGIGLENVKKRLDLIYGNRAEMEVKKTNEVFEVRIQINVA